MGTTEDPKVLLEYIEQKGASFETQLVKLEGYTGEDHCDPVNAKLRLESLAILYQEFLKHRDRLASLQPDHHLIQSFSGIENRYFEVAAKVTRLQGVNLLPPTPLANSTLNTNNITITERQELPKLPKVKIPTFDGDYDQWLGFKNKFVALVDSRTDISNTVKHSQLEAALTGRALAKISEFVPSETDYPKAWKVLVDSYDHKRLLIVEHLDAILTLPVVTKANSSDLSSLIDKARQHLSMLEKLEAKPSDEIIVRILERCLPKATLSRWEDKLEMDTMPGLDDFYKFIQATIFKLQSLERASSSGHNDSRKRAGEKLDRSQPKDAKTSARSLVTSTSDTSSSSCLKCDEKHRLFKCPVFNKLKVQERWDVVKANKLCRNCLSVHDPPCKSEARCKKCEREHHTLLHAEKKQKSAKISNQTNISQDSYTSVVFPSDSQLMTTAVLKFRDNRGNDFMARALLDSCSTVNLITERFAKLLKLPKRSCSISIGAVDGLCTVSNHYIKAKFSSSYNDFSRELNFLIVPKIADTVPSEAFPRDLFKIPKNLQLADPQFHAPRGVDVLLASGTTLSTLAVGQIKLDHDRSQIVLQKTSLGWIVAGGLDASVASAGSCNISKLDGLLERFWKIEDLNHESSKSRDEVACEQHYIDNTRRDASGRYIVRLPFREGIKVNLGESRGQALKRFYSLERKFASNPTLKAEYEKVMNEYIALGHMTLSEDTADGYYLPHHVVIKESSETTKYRVVFDASSKTSTGISLNDVIMIGSTEQSTIFEQMFRFRLLLFIITADIEKMYRQILVHPEDRKFQRVLWYHKGKIRTFQINTLVFGVASAAFLAIRTLLQLARDESDNFPRASKILMRDFYVDNLITGANSLKEILSIRDEMIELLSRGGFVIRQWASNHKSALSDIDKKYFDLDCIVSDYPIQKTLGIFWDLQQDLLRYMVLSVDFQATSTKRKLLSEISKIYDPLGLLGPVILSLKVLMQECWKAKITWDESLPQAIYTKWKALTQQLPRLQEVKISRLVLCPNPVSIEIHGFCDACTYGYGACIYFKSTDAKGVVTIKLACSKSRVAPLSGVTIPRLELCAASVLKKLYVEIKSQLDFPVSKVIFWSDATIVLCWLKKDPNLLKTFESNRVKEIQMLGNEVQWRHVRSEDNPADALSRGQTPADFVKNTLWFTGPHWLSRSEEHWPKYKAPSISEIPGFKKGICLITNYPCDFIYSRFSSFKRMIRVVAYILRWKNSNSHRNRPLLCQELIEAEYRILSMVQREKFSAEIELLATARDATPEETFHHAAPYRRATKFDELNPFLDERGLIRVGGRLKKSKLIYNQKHPILLPDKHHLSDIIIREYHEINLHAGIQSTLYTIRGRFWILNGKNQVRRIVLRCIECIRQRPKPIHAQMADLPESRVTEAPAFSRTGVDFFGPILIKEKRDRNRSFIKTYGCVFICMVSKAVHIELATDLSTQGFLTAFRRFIGRRGVPEHVYSDNGTNFVGANKELSEIYKLFETLEFTQAIGNFALSKKIQWHFNPPLSPHFGGLWEAAVKSFKHHLKRILKDQKLTYEQLNTLLIEIEAILNSRPMYALSADPNDPLAITPAHLLIGRPFNFLPEKNLISVPDNRLKVHEFITKARRSFWDRWHKEYLHELQIRQKWLESTAEIKPGCVVIMMEDNTPCARWPLGVIIEVYIGSNGISRVAKIKTTNGVYERNITRLCMLPVA